MGEAEEEAVISSFIKKVKRSSRKDAPAKAALNPAAKAGRGSAGLASKTGKAAAKEAALAAGDHKVYCICRSVSFGEMIGCDNPECDGEWFHMSCVGLARKPGGKWYCPDCSAELERTDLRGTRSKSASANGTYCDMISYSLNHLPRKQGTFEEVCSVIEKEFYEGLNWRLESHLKRTPVWTTFVRNQLVSNEKFTLVNNKRMVYGFA